MDLFIKADPENAKATYVALSDFGAPLQDIRPEDFTDRNSFFRFGREPKSFDVLPSTFPALILTPHGKGALKPSLIRLPA